MSPRHDDKRCQAAGFRAQRASRRNMACTHALAGGGSGASLLGRATPATQAGLACRAARKAAPILRGCVRARSRVLGVPSARPADRCARLLSRCAGQAALRNAAPFPALQQLARVALFAQPRRLCGVTARPVVPCGAGLRATARGAQHATPLRERRRPRAPQPTWSAVRVPEATAGASWSCAF